MLRCACGRIPRPIPRRPVGVITHAVLTKNGWVTKASLEGPGAGRTAVIKGGCTCGAVEYEALGRGVIASMYV